MQRLRLLPALVVFLAGYWPLAVILGLNDLRLERPYLENPVPSAAVLAGATMAVLFCWCHLRSYRPQLTLEVKESAHASESLLAYSIPYIGGMMGIGFSNPVSVVVLGFFLLVLFWCVHETENVVANPFLVLLGYRLYSLKGLQNGKIYSLKVLAKVALVEGSTIKVSQISAHHGIAIERNHRPADPSIETAAEGCSHGRGADGSALLRSHLSR